MEIDEILVNAGPARASHDSLSAQATKRRAPSGTQPVRSVSSVSRGRGRGRPPKAPEEKKVRLSGSQRKKL